MGRQEDRVLLTFARCDKGSAESVSTHLSVPHAAEHFSGLGFDVEENVQDRDRVARRKVAAIIGLFALAKAAVEALAEPESAALCPDD